MPDDPELKDWKFATNGSGWSSNEIAIRWLREVFLPQTKPQRASQWRHLIIDGHNSHINEPFLLECLQSRVWLNFLPAHCSQILQPLDVGPFSVLKRRFRSILRTTCYSMMVTIAGKPEFVAAWKRARIEALTKEKILRGWESTGIYPRDRSKALNSRLAIQADAVTADAPDRPKTPDRALQASENHLQTPKNSKELRELETSVLAEDGLPQTAGVRRMSRQVQKALDTLNANIVGLQHSQEQLKAALERQRPQKQRRVLPRAQQAFVDIADIQQAKDQLRDEAESQRPRRSMRHQQNRRSESPQIEPDQDEEIEHVEEEIRVQS